MAYSLLQNILDIIFPRNRFEKMLSTFQTSDFIDSVGGLSVHSHGNVTSLLSYKTSDVRELIKVLKYKRNADAVRICGELFSDYLLELQADSKMFSESQNILITTVPMHSTRVRERGDNHMHRVMKYIEKNYGDVFDFDYKSLLKVHHTPAQARTKHRKERLSNVVGSFDVVDFHPFNRRHIVVLDDVTTTGSTLSEISKVLSEAGAEKVECVTIAH